MIDTLTDTRRRILALPSSGLATWRTLHIAIAGVTPLLMHNPSMMRRGATLGKKEIPTPEVEAEQGLYRIEESGILYLKADQFR